MSHRLRTRGFTLVELLVVIAIIGILVALLLPAIQAARQAALKNSCRNNMKQLALACQNHNDTFKTFPSLWFSNVAGTNVGHKGDMTLAGGALSYSWIVRLLPFIEEDTLYKSMSAKTNKFSVVSNANTVLVPGPTGTNVNPGQIKLGQILCPSYSGETERSVTNTTTPSQATNYIALPATVHTRVRGYTKGTGTPPAYTNNNPPDGMICQDKLARGQSMARMADGTSKTVVLAESKEGTTANGASTTFFRWFVPTETYSVGWGTGLGGDNTKPMFTTAGGWTPVNNSNAVGLNFGPNPNSNTKFENNGTGGVVQRSFGPSSDHMGGIVIHGMGDGSVQEVTDTGTEDKVYFAAITARGGENTTPIGGGN